MITVTRVTVYDSANRHFSLNTEKEFRSYKEAVSFFINDLSNKYFKVIRVRMYYEEEEEK